MKMKVLLIAPQPFFRVRGTPINVRNLVEALGRAGHSVDLLCYPFGENLEIKGVQFIRVARIPGIRDVTVGPSWAKIPMDLLLFFKAFWLCKKNQYSVIHAVEESIFFSTWLARWFNTRLIYDMDSCISDQLRYSRFIRYDCVLRWIEKWESRVIRRADFVLTVCRSLSEKAKALYRDAHIIQIEDAPMEENFIPQPDATEVLRRAFNVGNSRIALYTGNFESYQGIDLLLHAIPDVVAQGLDVCFMLVGGEEHQIQKMKKRAEELQILKYCRFVGKRPMDDIPAFMTLAEILLAPRCKGTNTALKIYAYMQSGKPIVATRLETHTQVLTDSCAFFAEPDSTSFAQALTDALEHTEDAKKRGLCAKEKVEKHFTLSKFREKVLQAYDTLQK